MLLVPSPIGSVPSLNDGKRSQLCVHQSNELKRWHRFLERLLPLDFTTDRFYFLIFQL